MAKKLSVLERDGSACLFSFPVEVFQGMKDFTSLKAVFFATLKRLLGNRQLDMGHLSHRAEHRSLFFVFSRN